MLWLAQPHNFHRPVCPKVRVNYIQRVAVNVALDFVDDPNVKVMAVHSAGHIRDGAGNTKSTEGATRAQSYSRWQRKA